MRVDDPGARSRMEKLRAETALLKRCMQGSMKSGFKGDFTTYTTTVAGK